MADGFKVTEDTLSPKLKWLMGKIQSGGAQAKFLMIWGTRIRKKAILTANGKGGKKFWKEIARSVNIREASATGLLVAADHVAAAQKQFGGVIRAKGKAGGGADALTIPISEEAEGRRAADFALSGYKLFALGMEDDGEGVLGYEDEGGIFEPLFALRKATKFQKPDPWFPTEKQVAQMGEEEAVRLLT